MMICLYPLYRGTARERVCAKPATVATVVTSGKFALGHWRRRVGFMPWARPMFFGTLMQISYCPRHARELSRKLGGAILVADDGR